MPKALDFRITGLSFEDAGRRIANAPPPPDPKKTKAKKPQKRKK
ncbi:MAG: hypothetical protein ABSF51_03205 [Verrucomicrobiota bacterium]|jgi:hypothetical protein